MENAYHQKNNGAIAKLIYVHEGIEKESERHKLKNPYYFCRVCEGEENKKLWDEVYDYIENTYELSKVKKIYLSADGGRWIQSGKNEIAKITYVLDKFHIKKYLRKITGCFGKKGKEIEEELPYPKEKRNRRRKKVYIKTLDIRKTAFVTRKRNRRK